MTSPHESPSPTAGTGRTPPVLLSLPDLAQPAAAAAVSQPVAWNWAAKPRFALAGMLLVIAALAVLVLRRGDSGSDRPLAKPGTGGPRRPAAAVPEAPAWMGGSPVAARTETSDRSPPALTGGSAVGDPSTETRFEEQVQGPSLRAPGETLRPNEPLLAPLDSSSSAGGESDAILRQEMAVEQARANRLHAQEQFIAACRALEEFNRSQGHDLLAAEKAISEQHEKVLKAEQALAQIGSLTRKGYRHANEREVAELALSRARLELATAVRAKQELESARGQGSLEALLTAKEVAAAEMGFAQTEYITELAKLDQLRSMPPAALAARSGPARQAASVRSFVPPDVAPQGPSMWSAGAEYRAAGAVEGGVARLQGGIEK